MNADKPYTPPAIVVELDLEIRAGTPLGDGLDLIGLSGE